MTDSPCDRVLRDVVTRDAEEHELSSVRQVAVHLGLPEEAAQRCLEALTRERKLWVFRKYMRTSETLSGTPGLR